jgi:hypothetical protein
MLLDAAQMGLQCGGAAKEIPMTEILDFVQQSRKLIR